jgi:hypothetical protein
MKRKRGPESYRDKCKLPKNASFDTKLQHAIDSTLTGEIHKTRRYGFRLLWRAVPALMAKFEIPEEGTFDPFNGHNGMIWGWRRECNMTTKKAKELLFAAHQTGTLTLVQLEVIRKFLAYSWQLMGGDTKCSWPGLKKVWNVIECQKATLKPTTAATSTLPLRIPTHNHLKERVVKHWTPDCSMSFAQSCVGRVAFWDIMVGGIRGTEDVARLKQSRQHFFGPGWMATAFKGGRSKLHGSKKGTRPWKMYTPCCCPGQKHVSPCRADRLAIGKDGNPRPGKHVTFHDVCPVACFEFAALWCWNDQDQVRRYPRWCESKRMGRFAPKQSYSDVVALALDWAEAMGYHGVRWDHNSGRKSLGRWLSYLGLSYEEGFEIHADLYTTWRDKYQLDCLQASPDFRRRDQSRDPDVAMRALRKFVTWLGIAGKPYKPKLTQGLRVSMLIAEALGLGSKVDDILMGCPTDYWALLYKSSFCFLTL